MLVIPVGGRQSGASPRAHVGHLCIEVGESASTRSNSVQLTPDGTLQLVPRREIRWRVDEAFKLGVFACPSCHEMVVSRGTLFE